MPCEAKAAGVAVERPLGLALDTWFLFHCYLDTQTPSSSGLLEIGSQTSSKRPGGFGGCRN